MEPSPDSDRVLVWIDRHTRLPDTCCDCGLFTHNRVTVKHSEMVPTDSAESAGCGYTIVMLILHIGLGPLGWLLSALLNQGNGEGQHLQKQTSKVKISQCPLCNGVQAPQVVESQLPFLGFHVNPRFKYRLDELSQEDPSSDET